MLKDLIKSWSVNIDNPLLQFAIWLLTLVASAVLGIVITKIIVSLLGKLLTKTKLPPTAIPFVVAVVRIFCYVLVSISIVTSLGIVEASSIITALGAVGLAVSLAVKDSLSNLMGGVLLIVSKTFRIGDFVELEGVSGTVLEIGLIHTLLTTPDNKRISIPNGQVTNAKVINYSAEDTRRADIFLTIDRNSDIELAKTVLMKTITDHPCTLTDPEPAVRAEGHTELGTRLSCKVWVRRENYWELYYDLVEQFKDRLDNAGIAMPTRTMPYGG